MAEQILVTPEQLESAAQRISGLADEYKGKYDSLYEKIEELASTWQGADSRKFAEQTAGFRDDFQKMFTLMMDYVDYLKKTAAAYRNPQDTAVREASKLVNNY